MQHYPAAATDGQGLVSTNDDWTVGFCWYQFYSGALDFCKIHLVITAVDERVSDKDVASTRPGGDVRTVAEPVGIIVFELAADLDSHAHGAGIVQPDELGNIGIVSLIIEGVDIADAPGGDDGFAVDSNILYKAEGFLFADAEGNPACIHADCVWDIDYFQGARGDGWLTCPERQFLVLICCEVNLKVQ